MAEIVDPDEMQTPRRKQSRTRHSKQEAAPEANKERADTRSHSKTEARNEKHQKRQPIKQAIV